MTDVVDILTKGRHDFSGLEMEIEAIRRDTSPNIIRRLEYNVHVNGENLREETVRRAVELSLTKYCPVSLSLDRSTKFFARITLNGTSGEPWEILRNFELYEEQSGR